MGLRQTVSQWVRTVKDVLDFGPEFPAAMGARRLQFTEELAKLQHLLEQTRKASEEKDELIAKLHAIGAITGNMVLDGSAFYVRKDSALDGPFCTSCFQQNREIARIVPAPKPNGADGSSTDWVQCIKCRTPFRSERIGQYLNPGKTASDETPGSPGGSSDPQASRQERDGEGKSAKAARKPRAQNRRPKNQQPQPARTASRSRQTR